MPPPDPATTQCLPAFNAPLGDAQPSLDIDAALRQISAKLDQLLELRLGDAGRTVRPEQVDIKGASTMTGFAVRTITKRLASGRFPRPRKLGGKRMWLVQELREWMAAGSPSLSESAARRAAMEASRRLNGLAVGRSRLTA